MTRALAAFLALTTLMLTMPSVGALPQQGPVGCASDIIACAVANGGCHGSWEIVGVSTQDVAWSVLAPDGWHNSTDTLVATSQVAQPQIPSYGGQAFAVYANGERVLEGEFLACN